MEALNDPWITMFTDKDRVEKPICISALNRLKNFHCERTLEAAVVAYIVSSMNSKQNEEKLLETFKAFDKNHDGILSIEEIREGFKEYLGDNMMFEGELMAIIQNIDFN